LRLTGIGLPPQVNPGRGVFIEWAIRAT